MEIKLPFLILTCYEPIRHWRNGNTVGKLSKKKKRAVVAKRCVSQWFGCDGDLRRCEGMTGKLDWNFSRAEHLCSEGKKKKKKKLDRPTFPCQQEHVREGKWRKFKSFQGMSSPILPAKGHINGAKRKLWWVKWLHLHSNESNQNTKKKQKKKTLSCWSCMCNSHQWEVINGPVGGCFKACGFPEHDRSLDNAECLWEQFGVKCASLVVKWGTGTGEGVESVIKFDLPGEKCFPTGHFRQRGGSWKHRGGTESTQSQLNHWPSLVWDSRTTKHTGHFTYDMTSGKFSCGKLKQSAGRNVGGQLQGLEALARG